jgi:hypothetical protein
MEIDRVHGWVRDSQRCRKSPDRGIFDSGGRMTADQANTLEQLAERTHSTDADLLWLARLCSADEQLVHLGQVTRVDAVDMLATLRDYERYLSQVEAAK